MKHLRAFLSIVWVIVAIAAPAAGSKAAPAKWFTFANCHFLSEENRDADSFHVMTDDQRQFVFRLYFVDAPETDTSFKERVREQAEYFGISETEVLKMGEASKRFTAECLKDSFAVTTRFQNAGGRGRLPRYYALIDLGGGRDLGEMLVRYGWARAKGTVAILPNGTRAKDHMARLTKLEAEARAKRLGLWAKSKQDGK